MRGGIGWDPHPRTHGGLDPNVLDKLLLLQLDGSYLVSGEDFNPSRYLNPTVLPLIASALYEPTEG